MPIAADVATEVPPTPSTAREQLSFERYDGPGITVEVSLQDARYQVRCCTDARDLHAGTPINCCASRHRVKGIE